MKFNVRHASYYEVNETIELETIEDLKEFYERASGEHLQ